jgi:hypothetical protein
MKWIVLIMLLDLCVVGAGPNMLLRIIGTAVWVTVTILVLFVL